MRIFNFRTKMFQFSIRMLIYSLALFINRLFTMVKKSLKINYFLEIVDSLSDNLGIGNPHKRVVVIEKKNEIIPDKNSRKKFFFSFFIFTFDNLSIC